MRAIVLGALGEQPRLGEFAEPSPGPGQETVTVLAAGVNPVDAMIAQGGFPHRRIEPPCVLGLEGVGVTGSGSKVYFSGPVLPFGSFAERTLVRSEATMVVPDALAAEVAVALGVSGIAAELSLFHQGRLVPGETVLVLGASGMVGQITTQLARLGGAGRVIAGTRHALSAEELQSLQADAQVSLTYPETLDVVATTLETLAQGQRMVGVVTHVAALAERVPVRFKVSRDARTSSVIREGLTDEAAAI